MVLLSIVRTPQRRRLRYVPGTKHRASDADSFATNARL